MAGLPAANPTGATPDPNDPRRFDRATFVLLGILALVIGMRVARDYWPRGGSVSSGVTTTPISLQTATRAELQQWPGIGPARADKIIAARNGAWSASPRSDIDADVLTRKSTVTPATGKPTLELRAIEINRASLDELLCLPGVGAVIAQRIVETRGRQAFKEVDDLRRVPGIGVKTLEKIRPFVRCEAATSPAAGNNS
jgi:competence protein ComEA